jgi:hypothetical protein
MEPGQVPSPWLERVFMNATMLDVLTKLKARRRLYIQLACGLVFLFLVGLYTFSHNANLMLQGTDERFHAIGIIAAFVGELFVLYAFIVALFSAGGQRGAAILSDIAMLGVLLANTIVDYAHVSGHIPETGRWLFDLYASYGAPVVIVVVLIIGLHFILHLDHAVRLHAAEIAGVVAEQEIETVAIYTARDQMVEEMGKTSHVEKVRKAAEDKVTSIIDYISSKKRA